MADAYAVFAEGITSLQEFDSLKDEIRLWAAQAINKTADTSRTRAARMIRSEVNFPASYVNPADRRLYVSKKAQRADLEARITARSRATSLARFIVGGQSKMTEGVQVMVHPGKARLLRRAFLIKLRAGKSEIDTKSNLGLAVRLKPGETLRNKTDVQKLDRNLYLLYGPSVAQVFRARDDSGVATEMSPEVVRDMEREFLRLVELNRG